MNNEKIVLSKLRELLVRTEATTNTCNALIVTNTIKYLSMDSITKEKINHTT